LHASVYFPCTAVRHHSAKRAQWLPDESGLPLIAAANSAHAYIKVSAVDFRDSHLVGSSSYFFVKHTQFGSQVAIWRQTDAKWTERWFGEILDCNEKVGPAVLLTQNSFGNPAEIVLLIQENCLYQEYVGQHVRPIDQYANSGIAL
jgi:hypothetical protein